jgi:tripeptidyl-peptidase-1
MRSLPFLLYAISRFAGARLLRQETSLDLSRWNRGHEADANQMVQVSIALTIQNADLGVETLLRISDPISSDYNKHLSAQDVTRMFEPKSNAVYDVMEWLGISGIDQSHVTLSYSGGHLTPDLSVQQATFLLETTFYHQTHQETGKEQIACQHYYIPESLAGRIDYILAVSSVPTHHQTRRNQIVLKDEVIAATPLPLGCLHHIIPTCLRTLYNIPENVLPHPNNSFGIYEPSFISWVPEDLDKFFALVQKNLFGHRPKVNPINGGYLQRNLTGPNFNDEPNLDFEYVLSLTSPQEVINVQVGSDTAPGNLDDMLAAFDKYYCDPTK